MKAIRYYGLQDQRVDDIPDPRIESDEVLVEVLASSMDGTDIEHLRGTHSLPGSNVVVDGHEYAGRLVDVGSDVTRFAVGDRVTGPWGIHCGECAYCIRGLPNLCDRQLHLGIDVDGAWAEYIRLPERVPTTLPPSVSYQDGALMCCILPTVLRAIDLSPVAPDSAVAILGLGQVGLTAVMAAQLAGPTQAIGIDPIESRRRMAVRLGATHAIDPMATDPVVEVEKVTDGDGAELCLIAASSVAPAGGDSIASVAFEMVKKGGQVTFIGLTGEHTANFNRLISKEFRIVGSKAMLGVEYVDRALDLVTTGKWNLDLYREIVTHTIELEELPDAMARGRLEEAIKVIITLPGACEREIQG